MSRTRRSSKVNNDLLRELAAQFRGDLLLGRGVHDNKSFCLSLDDLKETSVHIVGGAGYGKSYYLRHFIDQLVVHRQAFGVIDPHREIYEYALWRLRRGGGRAGEVRAGHSGGDRCRCRLTTLFFALPG